MWRIDAATRQAFFFLVEYVNNIMRLESLEKAKKGSRISPSPVILRPCVVARSVEEGGLFACHRTRRC